MNIRDNLLVTMGVRAGEMHCLNYIDLPIGLNGEDEVAEFCCNVVDEWMINDEHCNEMSFDEWIEQNLIKKYDALRKETL